jgi:ABC-type Fe3+/spermidine/putrescine transport system ATPase subunit
MRKGSNLTVAQGHDCHVSIRDLCKSYGGDPAVKNLTIDVRRGEFLALLGPSGSGKTTLLMTIAGFDFPDSCVYRKSKSERIDDEVRPVWRANL